MSRMINIRPTTSVYATYKNINYKAWTAIAEFVDNSTQSFYDNKRELENTKYWDGLEVEINYVNYNDGNEYLEIKDNAFGMDIHNFERAIVLDSKPVNISRSEFGMGLKTAACWFGKNWSVESTMLGSDVKYKAEVNVELLSKYKNEEISVEETYVNPKTHGTTIKIWNLNRTISGRTLGKIKDMLAGIYRSDIRSELIKLFYNGDELQFKDPTVYVENFPDGSSQTWRKELDFYVPFGDKEYRVKGFVGIRDVASLKEAGFTLIRRGRVIIGGFDNNYRPRDIFGNPNSYEYQRIFGELNMDEWPVIQTKDNFDWQNGLEDTFIDMLRDIIDDYIKKAQVIRKRERVRPDDLVDDIFNGFSDLGVVKNVKKSELDSDEQINVEPIDNSDSSELSTENQTVTVDKNDIDLGENLNSSYDFELNGKSYTLDLNLVENNPEANWLRVRKDETNNQKFSVLWNVRHIFFKPFIDKPDFLKLMMEFILCFALTEIEAYSISTNEKVQIEYFRVRMNQILSETRKGKNNESN